MAEGRRQEQWTHTAQILCMIYNANRGKAPPREPKDFMPRVVEEEYVSIDEMRDIFKSSRIAG